MKYLKGKNFAINVISKSGTTTETSISFRLLKDLLEKQVGKEKARKAIFATTDKEKGALKTLCNQEGYATYVLPGNIGGRYSVLTAVGLFPLAAAGVDVKQMLLGAKEAREAYDNANLKENLCYRYAITRDYMYRHNKPVEMFVTYEPQMSQISEWLKQLFGDILSSSSRYGRHQRCSVRRLTPAASANSCFNIAFILFNLHYYTIYTKNIEKISCVRIYARTQEAFLRKLLYLLYLLYRYVAPSVSGRPPSQQASGARQYSRAHCGRSSSETLNRQRHVPAIRH